MKLRFFEDAFDEFDADEAAEYDDYFSKYEGPDIPRFQALAFYTNPSLTRNAKVFDVFSGGTADEWDDFIFDCMSNDRCNMVLTRMDDHYALYHDYSGQRYVAEIPYYTEFTKKQLDLFDYYFETNGLYPARHSVY